MSKARDRHKGEKLQFYINDDELARLDRLTNGCPSDKARFLKLMEIAENSLFHKTENVEEVKILKSQINKLLDDLKKQPQTKVEIREVPKIIEKIVEKPIIVEKVVEKPIEKTVEKTVYVEDDDWLPEYWPFSNQREYEKWLAD
jgi:glutamine synthetase adenylyltransferase